MVSCINCVPDPTDDTREFVITGGADKYINLHYLDASKNLVKFLSYSVEATPMSVDLMGEKILSGLKNGTILELNFII